MIYLIDINSSLEFVLGNYLFPMTRIKTFKVDSPIKVCNSPRIPTRPPTGEYNLGTVG